MLRNTSGRNQENLDNNNGTKNRKNSMKNSGQTRE